MRQANMPSVIFVRPASDAGDADSGARHLS